MHNYIYWLNIKISLTILCLSGLNYNLHWVPLNLGFCTEIIRWTPWISQVQNTGLPLTISLEQSLALYMIIF